MDKKLSRIYYEVSRWAARKRDGTIIPPHPYVGRNERSAWKEGYYDAMNEVAQHFNMERIDAERRGE